MLQRKDKTSSIESFMFQLWSHYFPILATVSINSINARRVVVPKNLIQEPGVIIHTRIMNIMLGANIMFDHNYEKLKIKKIMGKNYFS